MPNTPRRLSLQSILVGLAAVSSWISADERTKQDLRDVDEAVWKMIDTLDLSDLAIDILKQAESYD